MQFTEYKNFQFIFVAGLNKDLEDKLLNLYNVDEHDIEDIFTSTQLSKAENRKDYLYVAMQFPEFDKPKGIFSIKEVHCILNSKVFLLIDKNEYKNAIQFNNLKQSLFEEDVSSYDLFFEMMDYFVTKDFKAISHFRGEINELENAIFSFDIQKDLVKDILILKRNLASFYSVIVPLTSLVSDLQTKYNGTLDNLAYEKIDDTLDKLKKMINNLDTMSKHANLLSESNNALIARSTNEVIRTLTSISIIGIIPTMLYAFFGMNVYFGWSLDNNIWPLIGIIGLSITLTGLVYFYFRRRDWI